MDADPYLRAKGVTHAAGNTIGARRAAMQRILNAMYAPESPSTTSSPGPALPINTATSVPVIGAAWTEQVHLHTVPVSGISILRNSVRKELDFLNRVDAEQVARNEAHGDGSGNGYADNIDVSVSSNAPFLESLWNCVQHYVVTAPPVTDVSTAVALASTTAKGSASLPPLKIDVVANGGRRWVRLFTLKPSSLLQEFRLVEAEDVYDSSDDEDSQASYTVKESDELTFDEAAQRSSLVRTALELRRAADHASSLQQTSSLGSAPIEVDLILTRLDWPDSVPEIGSDGRSSMRDFDEGERFRLRLHRILEELGGIPNLRLFTSGTSPFNKPTSTPLKPTFQPKDDLEDAQKERHLNLDLSALVALCSDIVHGEPISENSTLEDSRHCFHKTAPYKLVKPAESSVKPNVQSGAHGRALAEQLWRECCQGIEDGGNFLHSLVHAAPGSSETPRVVLWTTREAVDKFNEIVELVAGEQEKIRAIALLQDVGSGTLSHDDFFWRNSRWASDVNLRKHLQLPVRIFEEHQPREGTWTDPLAQEFVSDLESIITRSLAAQDERADAVNAASSKVGAHENGDTISSSASISGPGPTAHTSRSLLAGCRHGMTTLTTNFTSVKWLVRQWPGAVESKHTSSIYNSSAWPTLPNSLGLVGKYCLHREELLRTPSTQSAVIWILHPRSFAEQMRVTMNGSDRKDEPMYSSSARRSPAAANSNGTSL
ncbi:hypothetical protein CF326_g67 [Tilletia indica]|nr:hypothetical protein CF326_g67 [Tilletia indica]